MLPSPPAEMSHPLPTAKRKRGDIEAEEKHDQSFSLTNLVSNSKISFEPLSRLLRAHLPLSWLAVAAPHDHLLPGSVLQGQISTSQAWEYAVLVAREIPNGGLVALEKLEENTFVAHRLKPFVSEKWIQDAAIGAAPVVSLQMMLHYLPVPDPICKIDVKHTEDTSFESTPKEPKIRKGAAARLSILSLPMSVESSTSSPRIEELGEAGETVHTTALEEQSNPPAAASLQRATIEVTPTISGLDASHVEELSHIVTEAETDMLSPAYLRQRYLEHLYMTKTSLAYYTKGPLSRARARARALDSSMNLSDLADFYRNSILPVKRIDLKYKESIKEILTTSKLRMPENGVHRKPSRKTKLGKDGLWPIEPEFVFRWWETRALGLPISQDRASQELQDGISSLRMREAQMQMVLMLEALSIEAKQNHTTPKVDALPKSADIKVESVEQEHTLETEKVKPRKQRSLEADLEVIADRLCIWHSIGLEGTTVLTEHATKIDQEDQIQSKDRLRHFCTDVLIPFYSSKLPQLCKTLCKMLAGPEVFEQAQKASRLKDANKMMAPGVAVKRRVPSVDEKEFARTLSENSVRQASAPALMRSATLPPLPRFKREASELSQRPPSRSSRQPSISLANREIDLVADAKATASKKRKLDRVMSHKQDLAAAIEALKKPNRHSASNAYMDEVEQRKPEVKKQAVHITATPKVNRRSILDRVEAEHYPQPDFSKDQAIPSSGHKPRAAVPINLVPRSSAKKSAVLAAIHDTPSKDTGRSFAHMQLTEDFNSGPEEGPRVINDRAYVFSTPVKPKPKRPDTSSNTTSKHIGNPRGESKSIFELPDVALKTMDRAMTLPVASSIYDTLGWNDEYDA